MDRRHLKRRRANSKEATRENVASSPRTCRPIPSSAAVEVMLYKIYDDEASALTSGSNKAVNHTSHYPCARDSVIFINYIYIRIK